MPVFGAKFTNANNSLDQSKPVTSKSQQPGGTYSSNSCSSAASSTSSSNDSALSCIVVNENRLKAVDTNHLKNFGGSGGDLAGGFKFKTSALSASHGSLNGQKSPSNRLFSSQHYHHQHQQQPTSMASLSAGKPPKSAARSDEMFTNVVIDLKNNPFSSGQKKASSSKKPPQFFDNTAATSSRLLQSSGRAHLSPSPLSHTQKCIDSILHTTSKDGKISKRRNNKKIANSMLLQCFNLNEKEKFRQLIAKNSASGSVASNNIYQNLIRSSPTKIRDDNTVDLTGTHSSRHHPTTSVTDKLCLPVLPSVSPMSRKVSTSYSRRISVTNEHNSFGGQTGSNRSGNYSSLTNISGMASTSSHSNNNKVLDADIIEIDMTTSPIAARAPTAVVKSAQKRHTSMSSSQFDIENEDALHSKSSLDIFKSETKDFYNTYHLKKGASGSRSDSLNNIINQRAPSDLEKRWAETLNKNASFLDELLLKSIKKSNEIVIEEERYKLQKRRRMEKERIEKEIADKFSQQLHLDATKYTEIVLEEEEKVEIEDDFPELDDEQELLIRNAFNSHPQDEVLINAFGISITRKDVQTLRGLNWLNDEVINFYMNLITERSLQNPTYNSDLKCYTFSTFFYSKLLKDGYASLKRWTRKVDIFSHNLILIPVHLGLHWTLAVIDFNCKEIRYYDSMNGNNNDCLRALKNYLKDEHQDKKSTYPLDLTNWNCIHVKNVPQQMNGSDCGMFACKYAEYISRGKTVFNFNQSHMPYFRKRMVWEIVNKTLV